MERARRAVLKRIKGAKFDHWVLYGYPTSKKRLHDQLIIPSIPIPGSSLLFPRYYQYVLGNQVSIQPKIDLSVIVDIRRCIQTQIERETGKDTGKHQRAHQRAHQRGESTGTSLDDNSTKRRRYFSLRAIGSHFRRVFKKYTQWKGKEIQWGHYKESNERLEKLESLERFKALESHERHKTYESHERHETYESHEQEDFEEKNTTSFELTFKAILDNLAMAQLAKVIYTI